MSGISAIISYTNKPIINELLESLYCIQHRGPNGYGIVYGDEDNLSVIKREGLLHPNDFRNITDNPTICLGKVINKSIDNVKDIQPTINHSITTMRKFSKKTYVMINDIKQPNMNDSFKSLIENLHNYDSVNINLIVKVLSGISIRGNTIIYIIGIGLIVFRDIYGTRPLIIGERNKRYLISSESISLDHLDYAILSYILPGEAYIFSDKGLITKGNYCKDTLYKPSVYEWLYLSNNNSYIDNVSVLETRINICNRLSAKINKKIHNKKMDYIVPFPNTLTLTKVLSNDLNIPYREIIIKKDFTFIKDKPLYNIIGYLKNRTILLIIILESELIDIDSMLFIIRELNKRGVKEIIIGSPIIDEFYKNKLNKLNNCSVIHLGKDELCNSIREINYNVEELSNVF